LSRKGSNYQPMRLAGGTRARQSIQAPKGKKTRPTSAKVREALFAILSKRVQGARVLDLFAGSGALGLEAMSRGAASVVFVDNDAVAAMTIRRNAVRVLQAEDNWRIMPMPVMRALRILRGTFDVVLLDPPYERGAADELRLLMQKALLAPDGIAVVEHPSASIADLPDSMRVWKKAKYGDTALTFAISRGAGEAAREEPDDAAQARGSARSGRARTHGAPAREEQ
jgi:16S rRNA (guanine966-N2)-methyltransferase